MSNIVTCNVLNESDKQRLRVYIEWIDNTEFKILLLRPSMVPLGGEMTIEDINYYSKELYLSNNLYMKDVINTFSGKNTEIYYYLEDNTFSWRKKKICTLGKVQVRPILDVERISTMFERLLECYEEVRGNVSRVEKENKCLYDAKLQLTNIVEDMIKVKSTMERDLYRRFLSILNDKKHKIRELQNCIKSLNDSKKSVFNVATDESEGSEEEEKEKVKTTKKNNGLKKRNYRNNVDNKSIPKKVIQKSDVPMNKKFAFEKDNSPKPSTSKDTCTEQNNLSNSLSSETECEIELRDTDESIHPIKSCLDGTEEELEEDLFSQ